MSRFGKTLVRLPLPLALLLLAGAAGAMLLRALSRPECAAQAGEVLPGGRPAGRSAPLPFPALPAGEAGYGRHETFEGAPVVWPDARAVVYHDPATVPGAFLPALRSALATWSNVPGSAFRFEHGGPSPSADVRDTANGNSDVSFDPSLPLSVFAVTFLGSVDGRIVERDVVFNGSWPFTLDPSGLPGGPPDFETVALHELGHVAGLAHVTGLSVMNVARPPHAPTRALFPDDEEALRFLYPGGTPGAPDLRVTEVAFGEGSPLPVTFRVENRSGPAAGPFPVQVRLGDSTHPGPADRLLGGATEAGLGPGAFREVIVAVPRPADLPPGRYRLRVEIEPEADAAFFDNRAAAPVRFLVERPAAGLAPGQTAAGLLGPRGRDLFDLALPGPVRLHVAAEVPAGEFDLSLLPPGSAEPAFAVRGDRRARLKAAAPAGGTWTLAVESAAWTAVDYGLALRAGPVRTSGAIAVEGPADLAVPGFALGTVTVKLVPEPGMTLSVTAAEPEGPVRAAGRGFRAGPLPVPEGGAVRLRLDPGGGPGGTVLWQARAKPGRRPEARLR